MKKDSLIEIGFCHKPHGIKGGFSLKLHNSSENVLQKNMSVTLMPSKSSSQVLSSGEVKKINQLILGHKNIVYFEGISDRSLVESMLPFSIHILRSEFPELDEDEFYMADIIGLRAYNIDTGHEIGVVESYSDNTVQYILNIRGKEDLDILFIDNFVPKVSVEDGKIWIKIPETV